MPVGRTTSGRLTACQHLDGVEDLAVARAPAKVRAEVAGGLVAREGRALLVDERLHPHEDPRRAEAALQGSGGGEAGSEALPLRPARSPPGSLSTCRPPSRARSGSSPTPCRRSAPCSSRTGRTASSRPWARSRRAPREAPQAGEGARRLRRVCPLSVNCVVACQLLRRCPPGHGDSSFHVLTVSDLAHRPG